MKQHKTKETAASGSLRPLAAEIADLMTLKLMQDAPRRSMQRLVRPRVGDVWAFGSPTGRPVTIHRIAFGAAGSWGMANGKITHLAGPRRRLYVHAKGAMTQSVASWLKSWCFVSRPNSLVLTRSE